MQYPGLKLMVLCTYLSLSIFATCSKEDQLPPPKADTPKADKPERPPAIAASSGARLKPVADVFVRGGHYSNTNYSGEHPLSVQGDNNFPRQTFLKFDLTHINNCLRAVLILTIVGRDVSAESTKCDLRYIADDSWKADKITWTNKPAYHRLIGTYPVTNSYRVEWDVTEAVRKELEGDRVLSMQIASSQSGNGPYITFYSSRTGREQNRPVLVIDESPHKSVYTLNVDIYNQAGILNLRFESSNFIPTGFYLPPGTPLTIFAEQLSGFGYPAIMVGTYGRYRNKSKPSLHYLTKGENIISDPDGGLIYLHYPATVGPGSTARIRFVKGFKPAPFYVLERTTNEEWQLMLDQYDDVPDVQLESAHTFIVASRKKALEFRNEDQHLLLTRVDKVMDAEAAISGLDGATVLDKRSVHKILMTESDRDFGNALARAGNYRTMFPPEQMYKLLTVQGFSRKGKTPWHELGHMHQQAAWTWTGMGNGTVEIYTLAAERAMGVKPSFIKEWTAPAKEYLNRLEGMKDINGQDIGHWIKAYLFHQLWLAYGDRFYWELHKAARYRKDGDFLFTTEEKMRFFMLTACDITKNDLSNFFKKWGFKVSDTIYQEIAAKEYSPPDYDIAALFE